MKTWETLQGLFYLCGGAWPLVYARTCLRQASPKNAFPILLVAGVVVIVGIALLSGPSIPGGSQLGLGLGTALVLLVVHASQALGGELHPLLWADAAFQVIFATGWVIFVSH